MTDAKRRSLFGCGAFLSCGDEADDLLVIHALVAGRGHIAAERAVDVPEPIAVEEQGAHAGVDLRCLAAKLQHGAPVVPLTAHGGYRRGDGGLRRRVAVADVIIIGVGAAVRPEGGVLGRVAHGHALGREGEPRVCLQIAEKEQELQELQAAPVALPDLTGCRIVHKMFGAGTVLPGEGQFMVIDFNGTQKKFSYTASLSSGYLTAEDDSVMQQMQDYQNYGKACDALQKELKNLKDELVKL